tara:strand:- start:545 stop:1192 length:648 start_codon:yes stop_codon:yes gene_type:complete
MGTRSPNAQRLVPCMPPLIDGEVELTNLSRKESSTKFSGTACELLVKTFFLEKGINVSEPYIDDGVDLLIEKPGDGWVRGQVKKVVYKSQLDWGMNKRSGVKVYRSRYDFRFQSSGEKGRRQRKVGEIDYFYHVLMTTYRQLIWEVPESVIPLRENGEYIQNKNPTLDRDNWIRKKAKIDFNELLIYSRYDPIIFKTFPDFFLKPEQPTLDTFFD